MRVIISGLRQVRRDLGVHFRKWLGAFVTGATMKRVFRPLSVGGCIVVLVSGCGSLPEHFVPGGEAVPTTATVEEPADVKYFPSDEPLRMGMEYFGRGNYGLAERYFRDAVEKAPRDATAWTGLAASYDRLRRFDLADRAYAQAIKLTGETIQLLNNQGYSFMMRGNFVRARQKLRRAYELDPANPVVINNLTLLNESRRFIERAPEQL
jgi:tetratricopeptide (TPR) repeat protein